MAMERIPTLEVVAMQKSRLSHMERVVRAPATAAGEALDDLLFEARPPRGYGAWRWESGFGHGELSLIVPGARMRPKRQSPTSPVRTYYGYVRTRVPLVRIWIELELVPWSDSLSALGIRPLVRRLGPVGVRRYERTGVSALDGLRATIEQRLRSTGSEDVAA
jgi:hypothetical protein